ncbi:MAG: hypothetical protein GY910_16515 [bacterium]|nr:hypothetical protein [bacterium]
MTEAIERGDIEKFEAELDARDLDLETLQRIEHEAYVWAHGLMQTPLG